MDLSQMVSYVRGVSNGVVSTLGADGGPQSAYLDLTATDRRELVFNARAESRKIANIERDARIAVVVGGADGTTLQCEGVAQALGVGEDFDRCAAAYAAAFPQFVPASPADGVVLVRVQLTWARFRDFRGAAMQSSDVDLDAGRKGSR